MFKIVKMCTQAIHAKTEFQYDMIIRIKYLTVT